MGGRSSRLAVEKILRSLNSSDGLHPKTKCDVISDFGFRAALKLESDKGVVPWRKALCPKRKLLNLVT